MSYPRPESSENFEKLLMTSNDTHVISTSPRVVQQDNVEKPTNIEIPQVAAEGSGVEFGNHSSSYWPPGWDFERYTKATGIELQALPADEYARLQAGLLDRLGGEGQSHLDDHLHKLARQRAGIKPPYPDWLTYLRRFYPNQPWGFIGIQTACFDDAERWAAFKTKLNDVAGRVFHTALQASPIEDVREAQANFEIRWIKENPATATAATTTATATITTTTSMTTTNLTNESSGSSLEFGLKRLRGRFRAAQQSYESLPPGMSQTVFLIASERSIDSLLDAPLAEIIRWHDPDTADSTRAKRRRGPQGNNNSSIDGNEDDTPWVLAVAAEDERELDEEADGHGWYKPVIKVAAENLGEAFWYELYFYTVRNGEPYQKMTRFTRGVDLQGHAVGVEGGDDGAVRQEMWWATSVPPRRGRRRLLA